MIFLDTSETLARMRGVLPSASPLLALAVRLASESHNLAPDLVRSRGTCGEFGALGDPASCDLGTRCGLLLWVGPAPAPGPGPAPCPACGSGSAYRQLTLSVPPARYRVEYWDAVASRLVGVEIATASPLVLAPPDLCVALIVRITPVTY